MPSPRKLERIEPDEAAKWRRRRSVLRNLRREQKYIDLTRGLLAQKLEDETHPQIQPPGSKPNSGAMGITYNDLVVRVIRDKLRLVPAQGESIAWVIRGIDNDVKAFVTNKAFGPPDHEGVRQCLTQNFWLTIQDSKVGPGYGSLPFFELTISPSTLRFDSSSMEMESEVELDIFEGGITGGQFDSLDDSLSGVWKELRDVAVARVDSGIRQLRSEMLTKYNVTSRTYPSKLEKEKTISRALVRFLLHGENSALATPPVSRKALLEFSRQIGIKPPRLTIPSSKN